MLVRALVSLGFVCVALAPLIGLPHAGSLDANPALPVSLITGTNDATVPPGAWDDPSPTTTTDGEPVTDCRTYGPAESDWPSALDRRVDMGHTYNVTWSWPLTLDYFDAHRLGAP